MNKVLALRDQFNSALDKVTNAILELNIIGFNILEVMPKGKYEVPSNRLYCDCLSESGDIVEITEIYKDEEGSVMVMGKNGWDIEINELSNDYYRDVIGYIVEHILT